MASTGRKVMIPIDGSPFAEAAYNWYMANIRRDGDSLVIVHIIEPPALPSFSLKTGFNVPSDEWKNIILESNKKAKALEEDISLRSTQNKMKMDFVVESDKRPGEALVNVAVRTNCSMIVMGTRGLGNVKRAFLGSVSDYVLRNSGLPTTIVPSSKEGRGD